MSQTLFAALAGAATTSDLYTVDPSDASMTSIGPIGYAITGLAFNPLDGTLWGSTSEHDGATGGTGSLISIDPTTGAGTLVGAFGGGCTLHDIAFAPDGTLWGWESCDHNFGTVDLSTGLYTVQSASFTDRPGGAFAFDSAGTFWHVGNWSDEILTIDPITLDETLISTTSDGNYVHSGKFDQDDLFWGSGPGGSGSASANLITIDVNTGTVTVIGAFSVPGVGGLAWGGTPGPPPLKADFTGTPLFGSAPLSVTFTDHSVAGPSGPITAWDLDFGDGSSHASGPGPWTHNYTTPGVYTVVLQVTGTSPDGTAVKTRVNYVIVGGDAVLYAALAGTHGTSDLYTVDPVTAVMTSVGPIGFACTGLAQDPTTGVLYGSTSHRSTSGSRSLIVIDVASGAGTLVGAYGRGSSTAHDIAFDASGQLWGWDSNSGALWKINKATGSVNVIGSASGTYSGGLDFLSGVLWKVGYGNTGETGTVNTSTGAVTFVANTSDGNPGHSGKFGAGGVFWASWPGATGSAATDLVTVDENTGVVTEVAPFSVSGVGGLAWVIPVSEPPDFNVSLTPSTINVAPNIDTLTNIHTHPLRGDAETITLSYTAPAGITLTFPTNPITAGDDAVALVHVGSISVPGSYSVTIHAVGTSNSHDVVLTLNASAEPPGIHIAS